MIKHISSFIDKTLWPQRVQKHQRCNHGWWWWIAPIVEALSAGGTAAGTGAAVGSAAGTGAAAGSAAIGSSAAGAGLLASAETVGLASGGAGGAGGLTAGGLSGLVGGGGLGTTVGTGVSGGLAAEGIGSAALGSGLASKEGLWSGLAKTAIDELTPFGDLLDPNQTLPEKLGNTAVKVTKEEKDKKQPEAAPITNVNNYTATSPNVQPAPNAERSGGQSIPPEVMMQLIAMMQKQKAQGGTRPLASGNQFPGGYY